ncbi:MAG: VCBS repeat-containing protein [Planctomycetota bacterium]
MLWVLLCSLALTQQGTDSAYHTQSLRFPASATEVVCRDLDGDGLIDLGIGTGSGLDLYFQHPSGLYPEGPDQTLAFAERAVAWDVAALDDDGLFKLVFLLEGRDVIVFRPASQPRTLEREDRPRLAQAGGFLPDGVRYMRFVRDLNGDQRHDLVIPATGHCKTFLREPDGSFRRGPEIVVNHTIDLRLGGGSKLESELSEELTVPLFQLVDVNGDGHTDVVSETPEKISYFLADSQSSLPAQPTFELDIGELEKSITQKDEEIDLSNLSAAVSNRVETRNSDVNGDGRLDFMIRMANKVSLFLGQPGGVDFRKPDQVLKASGNIVTFFVHDDDGDGRVDLHILRVEAISIGDVLLWLVKSGSLQFDLFVYGNEAGRFARRPSRHLSLTVRIPALLGFADEARQILTEIAKKAVTPAVAADLDGDGRRDDVVIVESKSLSGFVDAVPAGWTEQLTPAGLFRSFMRRLGYRQDQDAYEIDVEAFDSWIPLPASELEQQVQGAARALSLSLPLPDSTAVPYPLALRLNADPRDDLLVALKPDSESELQLVVVMSRESG